MIAFLPAPSAVSEGQLDRDNPWPGLASYDETSQLFFSGRTAEADELLRRILDEPLTVLFGKSGLGKTSLLHAGLFPRLRALDLLPVLVRLHVRQTSEPFADQVRVRLIDELRDHGIEHAGTTADETLWEYLHGAGQEFWSRQNRLVRPVFVFDQFEELFTLGRAVPARVEAFREDLADLAENRIPAALVRRHESDGTSGTTLNTRAMPYKIVIALREDFLADLEGWRAVMPSLRRNRMRLLPMRSDQALEAVCNERTRHLVSEPLARTIVAFLSACGSSDPSESESAGATSAVEPALLSLFCRGINEQRTRDRKAAFDAELLEGAKGTLVKDFYTTSLADQPERVRRFIEEDLVTESGYRNSYSLGDAVSRGLIRASEVDVLVNRHLLRREHHLGADRVELTHDLLTQAIVEARDERRRCEQVNRDRWQRLKFGSLAAVCALVAIVFAALAARASSARRASDSAHRASEHARAEAEQQRQVVAIERDNARHARDEAERARIDATNALVLQERALAEAQTQAEIARDARDDADAESRRSRSRALAAHAEAIMQTDPELAIALGLEGMEQARTAEARSVLIDAARYAWPYADLHQTDLGGVPRALALNADGTRLVVLAGSGAISLWDVTRRRPAKIWLAGTPGSAGDAPRDPAAAVVFSPDQRLIAVGRRNSVGLIDAECSGLETPLDQFSGDTVADRLLVFSPDGRWLGSSQADARVVRLVDLRNRHVPPAVIRANHNIGAFAVLRDGKAIVTVGSVRGKPLSALKLTEREGAWVETEFPLSSCVRPVSVSPGAAYVSATWITSACIFTLDGQTVAAAKTADRITNDIVWSTGGGAFVELLAAPRGVFDVVVGRRDRTSRFESRIKGAHPMGEVPEKSRLVSVSERGTRVALIDRDEHKLVRVYSVAGYKPFMSRFENAFAVSPDGAWIALARPEVEGRTTAIDVIPLEQAFTPDQLSSVSARISINQLPHALYATARSVVAVLPRPPLTAVFDAETAEPQFAPVAGIGEPAGAAGELLLFQPLGGQPARVLRTSDGSPLASWEPASAAEDVAVRLSNARRAVAVFRRSRSVTGSMSATLYSLRGEKLVLAGQVTNLPGALRDELRVADNARSVSYGGMEWRIATDGAVTQAATTAGRRTVPLSSPQGGFVVHPDVNARGDVSGSRIVRRTDGSVITVARNFQFSDDDRWLAVWDDALQVFDLSRGEPIFRFAERVQEVSFAGQKVLHVRLADRTTTLIPLEWPLMERFLRWLTSRSLTPREECVYGLREKACWNDLSVRTHKATH